MKNKLLTGLAIGAALVYCTVPCLCQSIPQEIPFRMVQNTLIIISLQVNGQGPFDFVLDTGTDFTIIDSGLADKLGLVRSGRVHQTSIAGQTMVDKTTLGSLSLGDTQADNMPVLVEALGPLRRTVPHLQGILSQDFLTRFNYLVDYSNRVLRIEATSELRDTFKGLAVPLEPRHDLVRDKMIITVDAGVQSPTRLHFVLDSGAMTVVLTRDAWERLKVPVQENRWEQTPIGVAAVHSGRIRRISLGDKQLQDVLAVNSTATAPQVRDGLMPTSLFQSFYINNRENYVVFNPRFGDGSKHRQ